MPAILGKGEPMSVRDEGGRAASTGRRNVFILRILCYFLKRCLYIYIVIR